VLARAGSGSGTVGRGSPQWQGIRYNTSDGAGALKAGQWIKLINRLNNIDNPTVPVKPSKDALPVKPGDNAGD
jgi:hypothetical protein